MVKGLEMNDKCTKTEITKFSKLPQSLTVNFAEVCPARLVSYLSHDQLCVMVLNFSFTLYQWSPSSGIQCLMIWGRDDAIIIEMKCTINVNTWIILKSSPPPLIQGKVVFHETCPWCQKGWIYTHTCLNTHGRSRMQQEGKTLVILKTH